MGCSNTCKLCDNLIISTNVSFIEGNVVISIPSGNYNNNSKYCIVIAQAIPSTATISSNVVIAIGDNTTIQYPLIDCCGRSITASQISTRVRYSTRVVTNSTGGSFKLLSNCIRSNKNNLPSIPAPTAG